MTTQQDVVIEMVTMMNMVELLKFWDPDESEEQILYASKKFKSLNWTGDEDDSEPVTIPQAVELMREWVWNQYKTWNTMYVYICRDNAVIQCDDGPYGDYMASMEMVPVEIRVKSEHGSHLGQLNNIYYQGWD